MPRAGRNGAWPNFRDSLAVRTRQQGIRGICEKCGRPFGYLAPMRDEMLMTPEEARAAVARSRAKQGLPPTIPDPETLDKVAAMVADALLKERPGDTDDDR